MKPDTPSALPRAWRGLERAVIELAQIHGWRVHHQRPCRRADGNYRSAIEGDAGFPDLVLVRAPRVLFVELKSGRGSLSASQRLWIEQLAQAPGVEVHVWTPDDLYGQHDGHVLRVLAR